VASDDSEYSDSEDDDCEFVEESPKKKIQNKKRKPLADLSNHNQRDVRAFFTGVRHPLPYPLPLGNQSWTCSACTVSNEISFLVCCYLCGEEERP